MTREDLARKFEPGYWEEIVKELGHNFFDTHVGRTLEYDEKFIHSFTGKTVLEVGGYPGLETVAIVDRHATLTVLDSPQYNSQVYRELLKRYGVEQIVWDIVAGDPKIDRRWNYGLMSDVLLHIEGFPFDFMDWLFIHCDTVILSNYPSGERNAAPAKSHTLHQGFPYLGEDAVIERYVGLGAELISKENYQARCVVTMKGIL